MRLERIRGIARRAGALLPLTLLVTGCGTVAGPTAEAPPSAPACAALEPGDRTITFEADGGEREALVHVPAVQVPAGGLPVLVALHGYSAESTGFARFSGLSDLADQAGFVVAYPQALGDPPEWHVVGGWSREPALEASDRQLVAAVLDWLEATGCVDPGRVFLAGHSQGGGMAGDLACELADRLAGLGLVSALHLHEPCEPARPIAVFVSHAVDDPVLPIEGGSVAGTPEGFPEVRAAEDVARAWAAVNGCEGAPERSSELDGTVRSTWTGCAAPVVYLRLPGGGHGWPTATRDAMWAFFAALGG